MLTVDDFEDAAEHFFSTASGALKGEVRSRQHGDMGNSIDNRKISFTVDLFDNRPKLAPIIRGVGFGLL